MADGAALEVLRVSELATVYRAYQEELAERGALDFGEQISLVTRLLKQKPNVLRRYQRSFRYILVDEFQDANIAQIELIELLGRTPDRPDNVMVVGDDDQSIYRFRGASFAAFIEFDRRFSGPPAHDPGAPGPGAPTRLRLEENFRSVEPVLAVANRLIECNELRYAPDKVLRPTRGPGDPVEVVVATDLEDEARQVVDRIKARSGWDPVASDAEPPDWSRFAVLYRKHRHREAIIARLRDEGIPYSVVGGLSLFDTPEIRDLEQSLRTIADPHQDVALVRMMSAAPWHLDALEILQIARMARYDHRHLIDVVHEIVESGELEVDRVADDRDDEPGDGEAKGDGDAASDENGSGGGGGGLTLQPRPADLSAASDGASAAGRPRETRRTSVAPATRAKLRRLLDTLEELAAKTWREGPFTVLEEYVNRTGLVLDLLRIDTLEAQRTIANIANFMRFAHDWQAEHPRGTLAGFVDYLDAYQGAGGELPTSVEASDDLVGVQLMTLYQAKGLEFDHVFVPQLLKDEWPTREYASGLFPKDLLKEAVPSGDIHTEEERRLLYVALTRAKDRLVITTIAGPAATKDPSLFLDELREGAGPELLEIDGVAAGTDADDRVPVATEEVTDSEALSVTPRVMPTPTPRERRLALRVRANELLQLLEGIDPDDPEAEQARADLSAQFAALATRATETADEARAHRLDPLTLQGRRARQRGRREPARGRTPAGHLQLLADQHVRALSAAVRAAAGLPHPVEPTRGCADVRQHRPCGVRGLHQGAPRAYGTGRGAAHARGPREALRGRMEERRVRGTDRGAELPWPRLGTARQVLAGRARVHRHRGAGRAALRADHRGAGWPTGDLHREDRPHRPPAEWWHRGHRLQDRARQLPEERAGEPAAVHLRPRLP